MNKIVETLGKAAPFIIAGIVLMIVWKKVFAPCSCSSTEEATNGAVANDGAAISK